MVKIWNPSSGKQVILGRLGEEVILEALKAYTTDDSEKSLEADRLVLNMKGYIE